MLDLHLMHLFISQLALHIHRTRLIRMTSRLKVGEKYENFESLQDDIDLFEKESFINLRKSDSLLLKTEKSRNKCLNYKDNLEYKRIAYICKHGGIYKPNKTTCERPNQSTNKKSCPFKVRFQASKDGQTLECVKIVTEHNHEISEEAFKYDYSQRKLESVDTADIAELLKLAPNRKLVKKHYEEKTGKCLVMKDIHNIASRSQNIGRTSEKDVIDFDNWVKENYPALELEYVVDDEKTLKGLFVQDPQMKSSFEKYPEVVCFDATYKTNDIDMPFYAILAIDGNGASQIVCGFLVSDEGEDSIRQMIKIFKKRNSKWNEIKVFITDKDMTERVVIKQEIPQASLQLCLFHVMRSFRREVTIEKMEISKVERDASKKLIVNITYARNERDYNKQFEKLCQEMPPGVLDYYMKNWHPIKNEWVEGLKHQFFNLCESTNNRIESFFSNLKKHLGDFNSLKKFIDGFISAVGTMRGERRFKIVKQTTKVPVLPFTTEVEAEYNTLLTPFAFAYVQKQLKLSRQVKVNNGSTVLTSSGEINVSETNCKCNSFQSMGLPCRHYLAMRLYNRQNLFCPEIVNRRWLLDYFQSNFKHPVTPSRPCVVTPYRAPKRILSHKGKYKKSMILFQQIAGHMSKLGTAEFEIRLEKFKTIFEDMKNRADISENSSTIEVHGDPTAGNEQRSSVDDINEVDKNEDHPAIGTSNEHLNTIGDTEENIAAISQNPEPTNNLIGVKFPTVTKKRGRPKGAITNAIGLPCSKKTKRIIKTSKRAMPFSNISALEKEKIILGYFVDKNSVEKAMTGTILKEEEIECIPHSLPSAVKDPSVDIDIIKRYFDADGWMALEAAYKTRQDLPYYCSPCGEEVEEMRVICDSCLECYHLHCVNLRMLPKSKYWYCRKCK